MCNGLHCSSAFCHALAQTALGRIFNLFGFEHVKYWIHVNVYIFWKKAWVLFALAKLATTNTRVLWVVDMALIRRSKCYGVARVFCVVTRCKSMVPLTQMALTLTKAFILRRKGEKLDCKFVNNQILLIESYGQITRVQYMLSCSFYRKKKKAF